MRAWLWRLAWLMIGLGLMATPIMGVAAAPAQQAGITIGESVEGTISTEQYRQSYSFTANAGTVIRIEMTRTSDDLDPYLLLLDQRGNLLAYDDDSGGNRNASIMAYTLPSDGSYSIIATRFGQAYGTTSGDFALSLASQGSSTIAANSSQGDTLLRYGDERLGEISEAQPYVFYRFQAQRGDVINIALSRTSGDLDPLLDLYAPDGTYLLTGDDDPESPGTLNARIVNFIIPENGLYYIQATRYGRIEGSTRGLFTIRLSVVSADLLGTRPSNARLVSADSPVSASITAENLTRFFQFQANRGDIVTVLVNRSSGDLVPRVNILREDLSVLGSGTTINDADSAFVPGVSIPSNGTYYISVTRQDGIEGDTLGDFILELSSRPGLQMNDALELVYGGLITGTIDNENYADTYLFIGTTGDVVTITLRRSDGDLDPLLTLRDEDGKQIISNDDGFGEDSRDSLISDFELPADGIYLIEVSRFERIAGTTSGDYILRLSAIEASTPQP